MHSQNKEEKYILDFFGNSIGNLLDIGANDGKTLSNSLALIEKGWSGVLVEPGRTAFNKLEKLHGANARIHLVNFAISDKVGKVEFFESEVHKALGDSNYGLLSTLDKKEISRWKGSEKFNKTEVECLDYQTLLNFSYDTFDFITIDAEGVDLVILKQIDLSHVHLLCIEHNSNKQARKEILDYCSPFGMRNVIYESHENILLAK